MRNHFVISIGMGDHGTSLRFSKIPSKQLPPEHHTKFSMSKFQSSDIEFPLRKRKLMNILRIEWNLAVLNARRSDSYKFRNLPDVYPKKINFSTIAEWAITAEFGPMLDVTYMLPEYHELRDFPVVTQWVHRDDQEYEYLVSINIPRDKFTHIVSCGLS
jgi:hypothetical protein